MMNDSFLDNLSSFPRLQDTFVWCDYIELRCLVHPDKTFSRSDLNETQEEMGEICNDSLELENEEYAEDADLSLQQFAADDYLSSRPMKDDRRHQRTAERYQHLNIRSVLYGDCYPFFLDEDLQSIHLKDDLTPLNLLYLQLMLSSLLRYCKRSRRQEITDVFENISYRVFCCLLPHGWEVHQFGKSVSERYTGHLFDKLTHLAEDVRGTLSKHTTRESFSRYNSGDGGLDLVAWHPMFDNRPQIPIAFAQCGCTPDEFDAKMLESSPGKLGNHLHVGHDWQSYYFMPQSMQQGPTDGWFRFSDFGKSIVLDRLRILRFVSFYDLDPMDLDSYEKPQEAKQMSFV